MIHIFLAPKIHEVQFSTENRRPRRLQMLRLVWVALDLHGRLDRQFLALHKRDEILGERVTHHVFERNVDVMALRAKQLPVGVRRQ